MTKETIKVEDCRGTVVLLSPVGELREWVISEMGAADPDDELETWTDIVLHIRKPMPLVLVKDEVVSILPDILYEFFFHWTQDPAKWLWSIPEISSKVLDDVFTISIRPNVFATRDGKAR